MCHTGRSKKTCTASSDASIEQEMWGHGWLKRAIWMSESACLIFKKKIWRGNQYQGERGQRKRMRNS